jgi:predicted O-methyltransferase YrrM
MLKALLLSGVERVVNTPIGLRAFQALSRRIRPENDQALVNGNRSIVRAVDHFAEARLPASMQGFEDLAFLFSCWRGNRSLIELDFDEAAYLFGLVRSFAAPQCVEIGRLRGGSTFLLGSALRGGKLLSVDLHVGLGTLGTKYDQELRRALDTLGIGSRVELAVGDSRAYDTTGLATDVLFIDGDHSYEGARADYEHWLPTVKPGGHIVFHDDYHGKPGVYRLMRELESDPTLVTERAPGTLAHFVKRATNGA